MISILRIASRIGKTVRGAIHGPTDDYLSVGEILVWRAYYSIEPYSNETKHLVFLEAAVRQEKNPKLLLPPECKLDQPLIANLNESKAALNAQLTMMAAEYLPELASLRSSAKQ